MGRGDEKRCETQLICNMPRPATGHEGSSQAARAATPRPPSPTNGPKAEELLELIRQKAVARMAP